MNKSVPGVKPTTVGMKWQFLRYEKNHQEVWNWIVLVWNRVFRYEIGFSLKNSGFSYLYGSISYLFGYKKNRCFFLMCRFLHAPHVNPSKFQPGLCCLTHLQQNVQDHGFLPEYMLEPPPNVIPHLSHWSSDFGRVRGQTRMRDDILASASHSPFRWTWW